MYKSFNPWEDNIDDYISLKHPEESLIKYHKKDGAGEKYHKNELYSSDKNQSKDYVKKGEEKEDKDKEIKNNIDKLVHQEKKYKKDDNVNDKESEKKDHVGFDFNADKIKEIIGEIENPKGKNNDSLKSVEELILKMSRKQEREVINLDK